MLGETWNLWAVKLCGNDNTDAVVLTSDAASVAVAVVVVEDELASSGSRGGDSGKIMNDGILGIHVRQSLKHSYDVKLQIVGFGSRSLLLNRNCNASMDA